MLRSLCNFGRGFAASQNGHQHVKYSRSIPCLSSSSQRFIHTNGILLQKLDVSSSANEDIPIVSITGIPALRGSKQPYSAVYWGNNDSMNTLKQQQTNPNAFVAAIGACQLALEQSIHKRHLDKVIIKTDSEYLVKVVNEFLKSWRKNNYIKKDGTPVKHKDEIKKLDELLSMIDAKIEYVPSKANNYVLEQLKKDPNHAETIEKLLNKKLEKYDSSVDVENVIFVSGAMMDKKAGYGIHFKGNEELYCSSRFDKYPVSLPRALMFGVFEALSTAKEKGLNDIVIVTDNEIFLKCFKMGWKTADGKTMANSLYYHRIKNLADELNVSFRYIPSNDSDFKISTTLAHDALIKSSKTKEPSTSESPSDAKEIPCAD